MNPGFSNGQILLLAIGIIAMTMLSAAVVVFIVFYQRRIFIINNTKEKELTEAAIRAEEEERMRIAAELHDDVGATLTSVRLYLQMAEKEGATSAVFAQSQQLIDESISKVRSLSHRLQPAILLRTGLTIALTDFFEVFNKSGAIHIEFTGDDLPVIDENKALATYRIVQELLNNTLKHAAATHAEVSTEINDNTLTLCYSHNGQGITEELFREYIYKKDATGLKNIINRLKVLNGTISFDKEPNWYHTIIQIPL